MFEIHKITATAETCDWADGHGTEQVLRQRYAITLVDYSGWYYGPGDIFPIPSSITRRRAQMLITDTQWRFERMDSPVEWTLSGVFQ